MTATNGHPSSLSTLSSKTAIITGGAGGIGAATVEFLHSQGANVVIADLPHTEATARALISRLSPRVVFIPSDILNWASVSNLFRETKAKFGSVEVVIANAGMMESTEFFKEELDESGELKEPKGAYKVIDVNLKGTMNVLKLAIHHMRSNPLNSIGSSRGSVILVSSTSGYFGGSSVVSYVSSKHGVTGLLRASQKVANEAEIRVNAVAPYFTPTHITSSYTDSWRRAGLPENKTTDVAAAIAQMATDSGSKGRCCLVAGKMMRELEGPREQMVPSWLGPEISDLMVRGGKLFEELGGYPLPPATRP